MLEVGLDLLALDAVAMLGRDEHGENLDRARRPRSEP